ncbi:hypothetical protein ACFYNY_15580 [Streptomyces sp. NPDC006530]|uniref:hypothetical protein n=1 Tax=Streptomyces sp. NPDC006530 TaxID=3364750 RepID=UPI003676AD13
MKHHQHGPGGGSFGPPSAGHHHLVRCVTAHAGELPPREGEFTSGGVSERR